MIRGNKILSILLIAVLWASQGSAALIWSEDFEDQTYDPPLTGTANISVDPGPWPPYTGVQGVDWDIVASGAGKPGYAASSLAVNHMLMFDWQDAFGTEIYYSFKRRFVNFQWNALNFEKTGYSYFENFKTTYPKMDPTGGYAAYQYNGGTNSYYSARYNDAEGYDSGNYPGTAGHDMSDGNWHEVAQYINTDTGSTSIWINGDLVISRTYSDNNWTGINAIVMSGFDSGSEVDDSPCGTAGSGCYDAILLDDLMVYDSMPGGLDTYCIDADGDNYWVTGSCNSYGSDPGGNYRLQSLLTAAGDIGSCDADLSINPGVTEICGNAVDEDCSGVADVCAGSMVTKIMPGSQSVLPGVTRVVP